MFIAMRSKMAGTQIQDIVAKIDAIDQEIEEMRAEGGLNRAIGTRQLQRASLVQKLTDLGATEIRATCCAHGGTSPALASTVSYELTTRQYGYLVKTMTTDTAGVARALAMAEQGESFAVISVRMI